MILFFVHKEKNVCLLLLRTLSALLLRRAVGQGDGDDLVVLLLEAHDDDALGGAAAGLDGVYGGAQEPTGRGSMGVRGIRLREGDYVIGAARAVPGKNVLTITELGYGKQTPVEEYRITARGGLGIKNYGLTDKTGKVVGIKVVDGSEDLMVLK